MAGLYMLLCFLFMSVYGATSSKNNRSDVKRTCMRDLGCFEITEDFKNRTINVLPQDRRLINTQFFLYTRNNPNKKHVLIANKPKTLIYSPIDTFLPTKFIVHGFLDTQLITKWQVEMKDEFMKHNEYNVIIVDWSGGNQLPYTQATANTRVVGAEIAFLINQLQKYVNFNIKTCHIIGHSLGAHIAGYAGERLNKLNRITALDPAKPYFQDLPPSVRIDPTDAELVDAIHTDSDTTSLIGLGMRQLVGHVDFFPNDGREQPGCEASKRIWSLFEDGLIDGVRTLTGCSHVRSIDFFKSSINLKSCQYIGHKCLNWTEFANGNCVDCGSDGSECAIMGLHADQFQVQDPNNSVEVFLKTQEKAPFCAHHYRITIRISPENKKDLKGKIKVDANDETGKKISIPINEKPSELVPGSTLNFVFVAPSKLNLKNPIGFYWTTDTVFSFLSDDKITILNVEILPMDYEDERTLMSHRITYHQETISPIKASTTVKMYPAL